jgi:hypothetical protein
MTEGSPTVASDPHQSTWLVYSYRDETLYSVQDGTKGAAEREAALLGAADPADTPVAVERRWCAWEHEGQIGVDHGTVQPWPTPYPGESHRGK